MEESNILLTSVTGTTETVESKLRNINGYLVYSSEIGGDVVTDSNVKAFLDDSANENLAVSFFEHLTVNTTSQEFEAVFYDNKKLATTFNDFYRQVAVQQTPATNEVIKNSVEELQTTVYSDVAFDSTDKRKSTPVQEPFEASKFPSLYIMVKIGGSKGLVGENFKDYAVDIIQDDIKYTQGFVNLNRDYAESAFYK